MHCFCKVASCLTQRALFCIIKRREEVLQAYYAGFFTYVDIMNGISDNFVLIVTKEAAASNLAGSTKPEPQGSGFLIISNGGTTE